MKKLWLGIVGLAAASTAHAAIVTYTMSIHEGSTGLVQVQGQNGATTSGWALYATVSQGDNDGLFAFGVDTRGIGEPGGTTGYTMTNRSQSGHWSIDTGDPNYDGGDYPNKIGGFTTGRAASNTSGVVSGVQDLAQGANPPDGTPGNLARIYGVGQAAHTMNDFKPGPAAGSAGPIAYGPFVNTTGADASFGTPFNRAGVLTLPAGTVRLASGVYTGATAPSIDAASVNTTASVWKLGTASNEANHIFLDQSDKATLQFAVRDFAGVVTPPDTVSLNGTTKGTDQAVGGSIAVTGSNNKYSSEVDQLLSPSVNTGNAPIVSIGDETGNVYVMAKLLGTAADINTALAAAGVAPFVAGSSDSQFAPLHANYDAAFGGGGFNALFKFANVAGGKTFNWEFGTTTGVTVDQLAAVPEPTTMSLLGLAAFGLVARRRRVAIA